MINKEEWENLKRKEKILKECCKILRVEEKDLPKTILRFKKEIEEMKNKIKTG